MATAYTAACDECGFTGRYKTPGNAAIALARHSCERQAILAERAERVAARETDGVVRDCQHPIARHEHGTRNAYKRDGCRCLRCKKAHRTEIAQRQKLIAYGRWDNGLTDITPVRARLEELRAAGIGLRTIAKRTGIDRSVLSKYATTRTHATKDNAAKILALTVTPEALPGGAYIDATGARRRLQALIAIGWSLTSLGTRLGMLPGNAYKLLGAKRIEAGTHRAVQALYEQLWDQPNNPTGHYAKASATRARNMAKTRGWAPPMAWDDETIDDPHTRPEGHGKEQRYGSSEAALIEDVHHLLAAGCSAATVAERLGRPQRSIERTLDRAGRHDLASWLRTGNEAAA